MIMGRKEHRRRVIKDVAIGSTIAAAAGYVAGILTAPKSGKETRESLKNGAEKELQKVHVDLDKAVSEAKKTGHKAGSKAKKELDDLVAKAKDGGQKAGEVLAAVRKGTAKDEDLAKALKQAQNSLNNLRKYLKK